jgi:hypothetical protein
MVVKSENRREPFNREKLMNGIVVACEKRPVSMKRIEKVVDDVERQLEGGGAFVAGAIIGGAAGLIAGSAHGHGYYGPGPVYHGGYAPTRRVCAFRDRYNKWGHYIGTKRVCWREPIY